MAGAREVAPGIWRTSPRAVTAVACFRGRPGRDREAALAWSFELNDGFARGVGKPPAVAYGNGIYTVTGIIQTTDPADTAVTVFSSPARPWDLGFCLDPERQARVRAARAARHPCDGRHSLIPGPGPGPRDPGPDPA